VFYSPRERMGEGPALQSFTALGRILDDAPFEATQSECFRPFRRKVQYFKSWQAPIRPLLNELSFTQRRAQWGMALSVLSTSVTKQTGDMVYSGARRLRILSIWAHTTILYALERDSDHGSTFAVLIELSEARAVCSGLVPCVWDLASNGLPLDQSLQRVRAGRTCG
jgi:hypothetical protein